MTGLETIALASTIGGAGANIFGAIGKSSAANQKAAIDTQTAINVAGAKVDQAEAGIYSAYAQKQTAEYNAAVARRNQVQILDQTDADVADTRRAYSKVAGTVRAVMGASGFDAGSIGSIDVLQDVAIEGALAAARTSVAGRNKAVAMHDRENLYELESAYDDYAITAANKAWSSAKVSQALAPFSQPKDSGLGILSSVFSGVSAIAGNDTVKTFANRF